MKRFKVNEKLQGYEIEFEILKKELEDYPREFLEELRDWLNEFISDIIDDETQ